MERGQGSAEKLSIGTKLSFGAGDIFGGGALTIIGFFYLIFLTDVLLIAPGLAGIAVLVSQVWDAVTDPLMGYISDRTNTRFGRRRPYLLLGAFLVFFSFVMMWYPVNFELEMHRFYYVMFAYIFFRTAYTIVMIPYFSLASELTTDYNERTSLTSYRMVFSMVSSLVCAVAPLELVRRFPDVHQGYLFMAVFFALFFSLPYLATFFFTKERKEFQSKPEPFSFKKSFIDPFRTPTFVNALLMYLFTMFALDVVMNFFMFFMRYYIGKSEQADFVLGSLVITQIVAILIFAVVSGRMGKKKGFLLACVLWIASMLLSFLLGPDHSLYVMMAYGAFVGVGSGGIYVMIYAIMPDIPDVDELYSGRRREGVYSGLMTFSRKVSAGIGIFIVSQLLEYAGYVKPVREVVDGATKMIHQAQSTDFIMVLRFLFALLPVLFVSLAIYNALRYRITPDVHNRLNRLLTAKRNNLPYDAAEEDALKKILERKES